MRGIFTLGKTDSLQRTFKQLGKHRVRKWAAIWLVQDETALTIRLKCFQKGLCQRYAAQTVLRFWKAYCRLIAGHPANSSLDFQLLAGIVNVLPLETAYFPATFTGIGKQDKEKTFLFRKIRQRLTNDLHIFSFLA